jgi:hypothetical protein
MPRNWNPKNSGYFHQLKEKVRAALASEDSKFEILKLSGKYGTTIGAAYTAVMKEIQKDAERNHRRRSLDGPTGVDHS